MPASPKHPDHRARRNATVAMTKLPCEGRKGAAPKWPLGADAALLAKIKIAEATMVFADLEVETSTVARERNAARKRRTVAEGRLVFLKTLRDLSQKNEKAIWAAVWKTPQATQWERRGWFREVAMYVRHQAKARAGSLEGSRGARAREARLGLNDVAMLRLRWEIADAPAAAVNPGAPRSKQNTSAYGDLRVV